MKEMIRQIIVWAYIVLSLVAFVRIILLGDSIIGVAGIVALNLSVLIIFLGGEE